MQVRYHDYKDVEIYCPLLLMNLAYFFLMLNTKGITSYTKHSADTLTTHLFMTRGRSQST